MSVEQNKPSGWLVARPSMMQASCAIGAVALVTLIAGGLGDSGGPFATVCAVIVSVVVHIVSALGWLVREIWAAISAVFGALGRAFHVLPWTAYFYLCGLGCAYYGCQYLKSRRASPRLYLSIGLLVAGGLGRSISLGPYEDGCRFAIAIGIVATLLGAMLVIGGARDHQGGARAVFAMALGVMGLACGGSTTAVGICISGE